MDAKASSTDVKLPDTNEPESKPSEQLSKADLDGVVGGVIESNPPSMSVGVDQTTVAQKSAK
jgi:hypothetical protein